MEQCDRVIPRSAKNGELFSCKCKLQKGHAEGHLFEHPDTLLSGKLAREAVAAGIAKPEKPADDPHPHLKAVPDISPPEYRHKSVQEILETVAAEPLTDIVVLAVHKTDGFFLCTNYSDPAQVNLMIDTAKWSLMSRLFGGHKITKR